MTRHVHNAFSRFSRFVNMAHVDLTCGAIIIARSSGVCLIFCGGAGLPDADGQFTIGPISQTDYRVACISRLCCPLVLDYLILSKRNVLLHLRGKALCLAPKTKRSKGILICETLCTVLPGIDLLSRSNSSKAGGLVGAIMLALPIGASD